MPRPLPHNRRRAHFPDQAWLSVSAVLPGTHSTQQVFTKGPGMEEQPLWDRWQSEGTFPCGLHIHQLTVTTAADTECPAPGLPSPDLHAPTISQGLCCCFRFTDKHWKTHRDASELTVGCGPHPLCPEPTGPRCSASSLQGHCAHTAKAGCRAPRTQLRNTKQESGPTGETSSTTLVLSAHTRGTLCQGFWADDIICSIKGRAHWLFRKPSGIGLA